MPLGLEKAMLAGQEQHPFCALAVGPEAVRVGMLRCSQCSEGSVCFLEAHPVGVVAGPLICAHSPPR